LSTERLLAYLAENSELLAHTLIRPLLIVVTAVAFVKICGLLINRVAKAEHERNHGHEDKASRQRETVIALTKNVAKYVIYFIMVITVLDTFDVPIMTVLSAAGVLGIAIAFGAQTLCRDFITGALILVEGQYYVGEYIETQGVAGIVEKFTLRCTYLRDFDGRLHILPNGCLTLVSNYHRGSNRVLAEVTIPFEFGLQKAMEVLESTCREINEEFKADLKEDIWVMGTSALTPSGALVRMMGMAETMKQWAIERALRKRVMENLLAAGMPAPYATTKIAVKPGGALGASGVFDSGEAGELPAQVFFD